MAPKTRSNDAGQVPASASVPAVAPVYRSSQRSQQIRFPSRRKIVKRYGRHADMRSPKQQTLTQAGYTMSPQPPPQLRGEAFELEPEEDAVLTETRADSIGTDLTTTSVTGRITIKRRKLQNGAYHTQTLTQFVARHAPLKTSDGDAAEEPYATIRDSEDEDIFASPSTQLKAPATPPKNGGSGLTSARNQMSSSIQSSSRIVSTPMVLRTEIPSSQPSPFTPVVLFDRYHSPLSRQRSSPLSHKESGNGARAGRGNLSISKLATGNSEEIPDSDEEDGECPGPFSLSHRGTASGPQASLFTGSAAVGTTKDRASPISSPPSSPLSYRSSARLASSTPLPSRPQSPRLDTGVSQTPGTVETDVALPQMVGTCVLSEPSDMQREARALIGDYCSQSITASDSLETQATQQQYSQGFESQRVPLEMIRMMGPQTDRSDIIISIHPEQIRKIVTGAKDHEFRNFKIPHTVSRFWIYATRPVCELQYMAVVAAGFRQPGEIDSESGVGNADFNAGRLVAKFAYKLVQVYQLNNPVSLDVMKKNGWAGPPRRYDYLPPAVVGALLGNLRCALFEDTGITGLEEPGFGEPGKGSENVDCGGASGRPNKDNRDGEMSVSQEIEAQLLSDISETQASQNLQLLALPDSQAQSTTPAAPLGTSHMVWPSQATTATVSATQGGPNKPRKSPQDADGQQDVDVAIPRPELGLETSSVPFAKDGSGERMETAYVSSACFVPTSGPSETVSMSQWQGGVQGCNGKSKIWRHRLLLQTAVASSIDSTQAALPDSLYEEVRQAPPAIILDSEESDDDE
ncbi:hypothetical protein SEUCBS139899_009751 [Sporothrix eucalyptigena]|uniref:Uncharacterized protein n=1 Tax=Sporothrix eucalyptigena TaxID=1812306 RepID=A0ABP0CXL2_9PEZI